VIHIIRNTYPIHFMKLSIFHPVRLATLACFLLLPASHASAELVVIDANAEKPAA
jgi:hypothetical protein